MTEQKSSTASEREELTMRVQIPGHSIVPISLSDLSTFASFVQASKLPLTVNQFLYKDWPNEAAQSAQCKRTVERGFEDPSSEKLKVVENETGSMVGHLVLTHRKPNVEAPTEAVTGEQEVPDGMDPDFLAVIMEAVAVVDEPAKDKEHLCKYCSPMI